MKRKSKILGLAVISILAIVAAGCGSMPGASEGPNTAMKVQEKQEQPEVTFEPAATSEPTTKPTPESTAAPGSEPAATPIPESTAEPSSELTSELTATPSSKPTATPTPKPTTTPSSKPTATSTPKPTATPSSKPTTTSTPEPEEPEKKPVTIRHYVCSACGLDSTDKESFMDHVADHAIKGEDNGYGTYLEEVWP